MMGGRENIPTKIPRPRKGARRIRIRHSDGEARIPDKSQTHPRPPDQIRLDGDGPVTFSLGPDISDGYSAR